MGAIVIVARVKKRHAAALLAPVISERAKKRLDRVARGAARVLLERAETRVAKIGLDADDLLSAVIPAVIVDAVGQVDELVKITSNAGTASGAVAVDAC